MDNAVALRQMSAAFEELGARPPVATDVISKPRLFTLGGDHSLSLPALRALRKVWGPIRVLHFDAHLDTWHPGKYPSAWASEQAHFNHGSSEYPLRKRATNQATNQVAEVIVGVDFSLFTINLPITPLPPFSGGWHNPP